MFRLQRILSVKERQTTGRVGRHSLESTQELPGRRGLVGFATGFPEPLVSLHYEETQRERDFSSAMTALEKINMTFILLPKELNKSLRINKETEDGKTDHSPVTKASMRLKEQTEDHSNKFTPHACHSRTSFNFSVVIIVIF